MESKVDRQTFAAKLYLAALRTGEAASRQALVPLLTEGVTLERGGDVLQGREAVLDLLGAQFPTTIVYLHGAWSEPVPQGDGLTITGRFDAIGASPQSVTLAFAFDAEGRIAWIRQTIVPFAPAVPSVDIPDVARGLVDAAMANGTPMVLACTDPTGAPLMSLRGSVQVFGRRSLSLWLRHATGSTTDAITANPRVSLLYRDSRTRSTLLFTGRARIVDDDAVRHQVFELMPEVEQTHDRQRTGAAMIVDVDTLQGFTIDGPVRMTEAA